MAVRVGLTKQEFLHSTPEDVRIRADVYSDEIKMKSELEENRLKSVQFQAWLTGIYVQFAVAGCFDNKIQYPANPLAEESIDSAEEAAKVLGADLEDVKQNEFLIKFMINSANQKIESIKKS